jgi:pimeloyl-ACP methyl ester carboxylesterase
MKNPVCLTNGIFFALISKSLKQNANFTCFTIMLHYIKYLHSTNTQWVTFVHGAGGSSAIWHKQIKAFKEDFNVLLIDLRGHGKSKEPIYKKIKRYTFDSISDEIIQVLDHLKIASSHFIGISLGTILIREITERYPERTSSLIMAGAVMKLNLRGQVLMRFGAIFKSMIPYLILYRFFAIIIMPKKKHRESRLLFVNEAKKLRQSEFKRWFTLISEVNPLLSFFRIKESGIPTLYVMGAEDHMFLPSISKLVRNHLSTQLVIIPECGHVVNVEKPDLFNSTVLHYLRNLPK